MLIDSGKVIYTWSQEPPVIKTREELKKNAAKKEFKNLINQGQRRTEEDRKKKDSLSC